MRWKNVWADPPFFYLLPTRETVLYQVRVDVLVLFQVRPMCKLHRASGFCDIRAREPDSDDMIRANAPILGVSTNTCQEMSC